MAKRLKKKLQKHRQKLSSTKIKKKSLFRNKKHKNARTEPNGFAVGMDFLKSICPTLSL